MPTSQKSSHREEFDNFESQEEFRTYFSENRILIPEAEDVSKYYYYLHINLNKSE